MDEVTEDVVEEVIEEPTEESDTVADLNLTTQILKQVRDLHSPLVRREPSGGEYRVCKGCIGNWPCRTAEIVFSDVEINEGWVIQ